MAILGGMGCSYMYGDDYDESMNSFSIFPKVIVRFTIQMQKRWTQQNVSDQTVLQKITNLMMFINVCIYVFFNPLTHNSSESMFVLMTVGNKMHSYLFIH